MQLRSGASSVLLFAACIFFFREARAFPQSIADFGESRSVTAAEGESIQAFDLSPDGRLLALLFESKSPPDGRLRVLIQDAATGKDLATLALNSPAEPALQQLPPWYVPHLRFSADARFLVVQYWAAVSVVSLPDFRLIRTLNSPKKDFNVPFSVLAASGNDLFLITYGADAPWNGRNVGFNDLAKPHVYNELVDISTGRRQSSWGSLDIPQSLSSDGKLAAVSAWEGNTSLVEVEIVDTQTGQPLKTLASGFRFKKQWAPGVTGRVLARFLTKDEILLSPDAHIDSTGHHSGHTIKIVRVSDGQLMYEIHIPEFGPTGEMAVSADRQCFAMLNWYRSAGAAKRDAAPVALPALIVFPNPAKAISYTIPQSEPSNSTGLETNEYFDSLRPRIANNAATVAIAGERDVIIFQRQVDKK